MICYIMSHFSSPTSITTAFPRATKLYKGVTQKYKQAAEINRLRKREKIKSVPLIEAMEKLFSGNGLTGKLFYYDDLPPEYKLSKFQIELADAVNNYDGTPTDYFKRPPLEWVRRIETAEQDKIIIEGSFGYTVRNPVPGGMAIKFVKTGIEGSADSKDYDRVEFENEIRPFLKARKIN